VRATDTDAKATKAQRRRRNPAAPPGVVTLPAVIDLTYARPLHKQMLEMIAENSAIVIDGAAVERASTPCIQVMLVAARRAEKADIEYRVEQASQNLIEAFDALGLRAELETWMERS